MNVEEVLDELQAEADDTEVVAEDQDGNQWTVKVVRYDRQNNRAILELDERLARG